MNSLVPDIRLYPEFLELDQAASLFMSLKETVLWNEQMKSRYTASFGNTYQYSDMHYDQLAMPQSIKQLAVRIAEVIGYTPNNCLLNYYLDGDSKMGFHSDDTSQLTEGTGVTIISLGEVRNMIFKNKKLTDITVSYELTNGSLIYMSEDVQKHWLHAIPKSKTQLGRISITFRKLVNL